MLRNVRSLHRLECVAHKLNDNLLNLNAIDEHFVTCRVKRHLNLDAAFPRANHRQRARLINELLEALCLAFDFAARDVIPQSADNLPGPYRLRRTFIERHANDLQHFFLGFMKQVARRFDIVDDCSERLIEFVGKGGCQGSHRRHARDMGQFRLKIMKAPLRVMALGKIA